MRQGVGMLLAELMRIKGEGDYDAIKAWSINTEYISTRRSAIKVCCQV